MRLLLLAMLASVPACFGSTGGDDIDCAFNERYVRSTDTGTMTDIDTTATAVGGKQRFAGFNRDCGVDSALELRIATLENPSLATVQIFNGDAVVTGVADGTTTLDTKDTLYSELTQIYVATIDHVALTNQAVGTGSPFVQILLRDRDDKPLVDDSLTVSGPLALGDHWDLLATGGLAPGDYAETIHAGSADWPVTVTVGF